MSLPKTIEEWRQVSPGWRDRAKTLIPSGGYAGMRTRPRDAGEERALRRLGADRQRPFAGEAADVAVQLRMARKRRGISQAELARRIGVTQQQIQRLEDPDKANPTVASLGAIAEALGLRLSIRFEDPAQE